MRWGQVPGKRCVKGEPDYMSNLHSWHVLFLQLRLKPSLRLTHPGTSAISALEAERTPAGHRAVISACSSLSRYASTAGSIGDASSPADVDVTESKGSSPAPVCRNPPDDALVAENAVDDDAADRDERDADDGNLGDGDGFTLGNSQECPMRPDRGERPPFCARAVSFLLRNSGASVAIRHKHHQTGHASVSPNLESEG